MNDNTRAILHEVMVINPWHTCAARVSVIGLLCVCCVWCVCMYVCKCVCLVNMECERFVGLK